MVHGVAAGTRRVGVAWRSSGWPVEAKGGLDSYFDVLHDVRRIYPIISYKPYNYP